MDTTPEQVLHRLEEVERRLAGLESRMGVPESPKLAPMPLTVVARAIDAAPLELAVEPARVVAEKHVPPHRSVALPAVSVPPVASPVAATAPVVATERSRLQELAARRSDHASVVHAAPTRAAEGGLSLERLIGGRFYAAIGAVVVVIGVGMFLKLAMDNGWLKFPPGMRCLAAAAFGLGLMAAGELARRKINAAGAAGLSAAGLATMYTSGLAAFGMYKLLSAPVAFVLLAAVSGLGVVVALRSRQALMAVLSLVAAYVTPVMLYPFGFNVYVMPAYLCSLLGFGLWLSASHPRPFLPVRSVVWWGTAILGFAWSVRTAGEHAILVQGFLCAVWLAVHAELVVGAVRMPVDRNELNERSGWRSIRPVLASFACTIWAVGLGVLVSRLARVGVNPPDWFSPGAGFAAAMLIGLMLAGTLRVFRDAPRGDGQRLGAGLLMQAGALLVATVALALTSWIEVVAWLGMGLAGVAAGRWMRSRALSLYGQSLLTIAVGRLVLYDSWHLPPGSVDVAGLHLTRWTALMAAAAGSYAAAGVMMRVREATAAWRSGSDACFGAAWVLLFASLVHPEASVGSLGVMAALASAALLVHGHAMGRGKERGIPALFVFGVGFLAVAMGMGGMVHQLDLLPQTSLARVAGLAINPLSISMAVMGMVWVLAAALAGRSVTADVDAFDRRVPSTNDAVAMGSLWAAAVCAMLIPQIGMSAGVSVCLWWLACAVVAMAMHGVMPRRGFDLIGLAVMGASVVAWTNVYVLRGWMRSAPESGIHPGFGVAMLLCGALFAMVLLLSRGPARMRTGFVVGVRGLWVAVALVLFASTSLELDRAGRLLMPHDTMSRAGLVSIWWGLFAVALLTIGFVKAVPVVRHCGLALLGVATLKAILIDLAEVAPEWRVASFIGLGLLMLGVAVVYARVGKKLSAAA